MTLSVAIKKSKQVSKWIEYKDAKGKVLAEFKIRGIKYQAYQSALERCSNQISSKGYNVAAASTQDKLYHELLLEAVACHLIEDWKGIEFDDLDTGKVYQPAYSPENATKLLNIGDIGIPLHYFIVEQAKEIQAEADAEHEEVLGK